MTQHKPCFDMTLLVRNNSPSAPKVWLSQDHRQLEVEIIFSTIPTKSKQKPHLHKTWLSADPEKQGGLSQSCAETFT